KRHFEISFSDENEGHFWNLLMDSLERLQQREESLSPVQRSHEQDNLGVRKPPFASKLSAFGTRHLHGFGIFLTVHRVGPQMCPGFRRSVAFDIIAGR